MVASSPLARPRVLYVDDEPLVLEGLVDLLRRRFDVVTAASCQAALALVAGAPGFDVIVSDFQMPVMNGAEFLARARERSERAVHILLTGQASLDGAIAAVNQGGIFRFLTKPCPPALLLRTIDEAALKARLAGSDQATLAREVASIGRLLLRSEQLATLGTMVATVGHELNNVLSAFQGALAFVRESRAQGRPAEEEDVEMLAAVAGHLEQHARQLQRLGKPAAGGEGAPADLCAVVADVAAMLGSTGALRHVDVSLELPGRPLTVRLDRTRAQQILVNLVKNAADACADAKGRLRRVRVSVAADAALGVVTCSVEDSGTGIPEAQLDAIFEPYFTTKSSDRGTGLGLYVVQRILLDVGGDIAVTSQVDVGTRFVVTLPMAGGHA
jgi:signal transduction histidine kinase